MVLFVTPNKNTTYGAFALLVVHLYYTPVVSSVQWVVAQ